MPCDVKKFIPHEYQKYCIDKILEIKKIGLFLDMGLGKTITTLTAVKELKYNRFEVQKILVIAPKKVAEGTWTKEKDKMGAYTDDAGIPDTWKRSKKGYVPSIRRLIYTSSIGRMWCGWWIITVMPGRLTMVVD